MSKLSGLAKGGDGLAGVRLIALTTRESPRSSGIVHHVAYAYTSGGLNGYQLLCAAPWVEAHSTYHARVVTEIDPIGRTLVISLTRDPVDCMTCLVNEARR